MTLFEFMEHKKLSYRKAGEFFGMNHTTLYKYAQGQRTPRLKVALKIVKKSKGMIKVEELLGEG